MEEGSKVADRYVIEAKLGAGGMGAVYRARDERLGREIALKLLAPEQVGDAGAVARLLREAQATATLEHDHIVPVYDVGPTGDGGAYLAMQLVEGQTLRARMEGEGLSHEEALHIVADVGDALAHAHDAGVVHRDVKPDNVMLRARDGRTLVLDFGLARFTEPDQDLHKLTADGSFVGTPAYLAPEQARGSDVDGRVDQFALAVMTWELLAGRSPWSGTTLPSILANILADQPEALTSAADGVDPHVSEAVQRALSKDPDERFPTMGDFVAALLDDQVASPDVNEGIGLLDTMQSGSVAAAPSVTSSPRSRRPLVYGLGVAVVAAGLYAFYPEDVPDSPTAEAPPEEPAGVGLRDLPAPTGCNPEALAHYEEGILALRNGNADSARAAFVAAVEADDHCAAAHMRRVYTRSWRDDAAVVRRSFQRARRFRESLSERDRAVLDAFGARYLGDSEPAAVREALFALTEEFPNDAEILRVAGTQPGRPAEQRLAWLNRALEIDPEYALAWVSMAGVHHAAGDMDAAYEAIATCRSRIEGAADCIGQEIFLLSLERRCSEILEPARAMVQAQGSTDDRLDLADALACNGSSREAIARELQAAVAAGWLPHLRFPRGIDVAFHFGDLDEAERLAWEALTVDDLPASTRTEVVARLVESLWEQGRGEEARAQAVTRLRSLDGAGDYLAQGWYMAAEHARLFQLARPILAEDEARRLFEDFGEQVRGGPQFDEFDVAAVTELGLAETREEAVAGLARMPPVSDMPAATSDALYGRALLLAGRHDEAASALRRVTGSCYCLQLPLWRLRARLWLAEALAATGDLEGACESARVVHQSWNELAPRSRLVTAARAFLERCD